AWQDRRRHHRQQDRGPQRRPEGRHPRRSGDPVRPPRLRAARHRPGTRLWRQEALRLEPRPACVAALSFVGHARRPHRAGRPL
ncbi:MAG: hypothetical protein AVDCRST_MAG31-1855, partial [uncultured Sphingomonas sp.]